jgi:hypothetical protein
VLDSIRRTGERYGDRVRRVFLADGDALVLPTRRLLAILDAIRQHLPAVHRVSSYCLARNLKKKSVAELTQLREAGLAMVLGAESGDDEVLAKVSKGETFDSTRDALDKLGAAGITRSVMILNGLGGQVLSAQHADNSARLANATQPEYLSTLVVSFPQGEARFRAGFPEWEPLDQHRPVPRDGTLPVAARPAPHGVQVRPRQQLAGAQGHPRRRQGPAAGAGACRHRRTASRPPAAGVGAGLVSMPHQHLLTFTTRPRATLDITADVAAVVRASGMPPGWPMSSCSTPAAR